jgi:hypothetical protein
LRAAAKQLDPALIAKNGKLARRLSESLKTASPNSSEDLITGIAVDLADFWEIGEEHKRVLKKLLRMRFPKDKKRFENVLCEIDIRLVLHAEWHARALKIRLKKLRQDLSAG